MNDKVRILLDTDANNEIDDQQAIAYMLLSGDTFIVEGLTVNRTNNGGDIEEQAKEAERVVKLCALHPQLPVIRGASGSFAEIAPHLHESEFDGFAAVNLIIQRAHSPSTQKLVVLAIGKLTNVDCEEHCTGKGAKVQTDFGTCEAKSLICCCFDEGDEGNCQ